MHDSALLLKTIAPKLRADHVSRERLNRFFLRHVDTRAIAVEAPAGFGKTVLLAQWRSLAASRGATSTWLSLGRYDDAQQVLDGIIFGLRRSSGRAELGSSGDIFLEKDQAVRRATALLAEWAGLPGRFVVVVDDFHSLENQSATQLLIHLLNNLPPNCQFLLGSRPVNDRAWLMDLQAYGQLAILDHSGIAFSMSETLEFLTKRTRSHVDDGLAARLFAQTEGWPVGLELSAARIASGVDAGMPPPHHADPIREVEAYFLRSIYEVLSVEDREFLIDIAILDHLCVDLCNFVTQKAQASRVLDTLRATSAVELEDDGRRWLRLHQLAIDGLRREAALMPPDRLAHLHQRAAQWHADHHLWDAAAEHAFAASDETFAIGCVKKSLLNTLRSGKLDMVARWLDRLPEAEIFTSIDVQLAVARCLAVAGRPARAISLCQGLLENFSEDVRYRAAVVCATASVHMDDPEAAKRYVAEWPERPPTADLVWQQPYANLRRWLAETSGQVHCSEAPPTWDAVIANAGPAVLTESMALHEKAVGYLNAAQPRLAIGLLAPFLARLEATLGPRSGPAVLIAQTLAGASAEINDLAQVRALMANRLDLIDPGVMPIGSALGHLAIATLARADGLGTREFDVLDTFRSRSASRGLVRNEARAIGELIRFHADAQRKDTSEGLLHQLLALAAGLVRDSSLRKGDIDLQVLLAQVRVARLRREFQLANMYAHEALKLAKVMGRRRVEIEVRLLVAGVDQDRTGQASSELAEVVGLARLHGLERLVIDLAPDVISDRRIAAESVPEQRETHLQRPGAVMALKSMLLTARESQILQLLDRSLSNKEIAQCLEMGDGTVKWHVKNLFSKLDAHGRRAVVAKARLLGLLQ